MAPERLPAARAGPSRPCAHSGCRAWAMRGRAFCRAHERDEPAVEPSAGGGTEEQRFYRELLDRRMAEARAGLPAGGEATLEEEIRLLRLVLAKVLAEAESPAQLASSVPRLADAVVRAVRAQRALSGEMARDLTESVTRILLEMGMDEAR